MGGFGGAVEIRWALSAAEELNGSSNHCSCGLRFSTAAHAWPLKEISTQGLGWNKDHALFVVSLLGALRLEKKRTELLPPRFRKRRRRMEGSRHRQVVFPKPKFS